MKYTWEEKDLRAGVVVCKDPSYQGNKKFIPCGNAWKWTQMIGYCWDHSHTQKWALISLCDGLIQDICDYKDRSKMVEVLNTDEYIPMPHNWLIEAMRSHRACNELY